MFLVEMRRFFYRRSFRLFALVCLAGIVFAAVTVFVVSKPTEQFRLRDLVDIYEGTSIPLIILGLAIGASFIGAEWQAGTMTTLLTWEPRRVRVMISKIVAVAVGVALGAVALQVVLGLALVPAAALRGSTEGIDAAWFGEAAEVVGRGAMIAGLLAIIGFAGAALARNTTATLILGFVYFAIGEAILRGLKPSWQEWLIGDNAAAFVTAEPESVFGPSNGRSLVASLFVVALYALIGSTLATGWFQRRDVG